VLAKEDLHRAKCPS
jgi:hypothetical protein